MKSRWGWILVLGMGAAARAADPVKPADFTEALGDLPDGGQAPTTPAPTASAAAPTSASSPDPITKPAAPSSAAAPDAAKPPAAPSAPQAEVPPPPVEKSAVPASPADVEAAPAETAVPPPVEKAPAKTKKIDSGDSFDAAAEAAMNSAVPAQNAAAPSVPSSPKPAAPNAAAAVKPDELPPEIRALEQSLDAGTTLPKELYEPTEPGGALRPSERFARIPLRPPMSDANWRKWAGPMLEKNYRIHRRDTLWGISERLFGTPYLWPKVWQLNAVITNPNVVDPGLELMFTPGNPNSAPILAFKSFPGTTSDDVPLASATRKRGFMEMLDESLRAQILSSHPPFQYFLLDERPKTLAKVPAPENSNRVYHEEGDSFAIDLPDGEYTIIRVEPVENKTYKAYRVQWNGTLQASHRRAVITRAFSEIASGDLIVARSFRITPLALHESRIGPADREQTFLVPLQEGYQVLTSQNMIVGLRFAGADRGPRAGALLTLSHGARKVATLLLIDRDKRMGTAWVVESERELSSDTDRID